MNWILTKLIGGVLNWQTTVTGLIAAIVTALNAFGVIAITQDVQNALVVLAIFIIGFFASDTDNH